MGEKTQQKSPAGSDETRRGSRWMVGLMVLPNKGSPSGIPHLQLPTTDAPPVRAPHSAAPYRCSSSRASTRCSFLCSLSATRCSLALFRSVGSVLMSSAVAAWTSHSVIRSKTPPTTGPALCSPSAPPPGMWCSSSLRRRLEMFWRRRKAGRMSRR